MSDGGPIREDGRRRDPDRSVRGFSNRATPADLQAHVGDALAAIVSPADEGRTSVPALGGT